MATPSAPPAYNTLPYAPQPKMAPPTGTGPQPKMAPPTGTGPQPKMAPPAGSGPQPNMPPPAATGPLPTIGLPPRMEPLPMMGQQSTIGPQPVMGSGPKPMTRPPGSTPIISTPKKQLRQNPISLPTKDSLKEEKKSTPKPQKKTKPTGQLIYSFECVIDYNQFTGISPKFKPESFPYHLLAFVSEEEAENLRATFNALISDTRANRKYVVLPFILYFVVLGLTAAVFGTPTTVAGWICGLIIPAVLLSLVVFWYTCTRQGNRMAVFNSTIEQWNAKNTDKGLSLELSNKFWDSLYPAVTGMMRTDHEAFRNLPNVYIHLYHR